MSSQSFDPWKLYHESPTEQAAIKARAKYREAMKEEYRRLKTNPFNPPRGVMHDPNMQRWFSARVTYAEFLKPSTKGVFLISMFFGVSTLFFYMFTRRRERLLDEVRRGEVDYRTRALTFAPK